MRVFFAYIRVNEFPYLRLGGKEIGKMKRDNIPNGFTLIEVIIVIALIAIMLSFAIPGWKNYQNNTNLKTAASQISSDLMNTRMRTISEKKPASYSMTFNTGDSSYRLSRTDASGTTTLWTKSQNTLGTGIIIQSADFNGGAVVSFQRRGTVTPGTAILKNGIGSTATLTTQMTGRVYVQYNLQK